MGYKFVCLGDTVKCPCLFTPFSFIHFITGAGFYIYIKYFFKNISLINSFFIMLGFHTLYEIRDLLYYFGYKRKRTIWEDNSFVNTLADTLCSIFGFLLLINIKTVTKSIFCKFTIIYLIILVLFLIVSIIINIRNKQKIFET